jgi:hypothetical protein
MLFELLFLLAHRNRPAPGTQRRRQNGRVTLECPLCHALGVATQFTVEQFTGETWGRSWQVLRDVYQCPACNAFMNAEAFKNDGTGVLTVRTWDCPACTTDNSALTFQCQNCGFTLR